MSRWFRFYDCALDDPKVQKLPAELFKAWVNLLCVASRNGGILPAVEDLSFMLRKDEETLARVLSELQRVGLIDESEQGLTPHNWSTRQYQSDNSAERVRKHREAKRHSNVSPVTECNVTCNDDVSYQNRYRADTEISLSETSSDARVLEFPEKVKQDKPKRQRHAYSAAFEEFWQAYPTDPLMSKAQAAKQFERLSDEDKRKAIAAVPEFRAHCRKTPDYRPVHAERFISQRRFDGFARGSPEAIPFDPVAHQANLDRILGRTKANA